MRTCLLLLVACASPPARPVSPPAILVVTEAERAEETAWLASFGLRVPPGGVLLEQPFAPPYTRRSFIVPTARYRESGPTTVMPAALAADLDVLAIAFERVYGGYERARARGFDFARWFARWKERLHGAAPLPVAEAFAPLHELMAVQLDNHTGAILEPRVRFGSGSRTARLASLPDAPCTRMRTADGVEHALAPSDRAAQPRQAPSFDGARLRPVPHLVFPAVRGQLAAVLCGERWIDALPADPATADERHADMRALAGGPDDVPAYTTLANDVGYVRLPTFSKRATEKLQELPASLPASAGKERALIVDLRFNDGGDGGGAFDALGRWIDLEQLQTVAFERTEKQSCLVDALMWGYTQLTMARMTPPISDELREMLQEQIASLAQPSEAGCPVTVKRIARNWSYEQRRFQPSGTKPVLVVLVNEQCGSDCEYVAAMLATRPDAVIVGVNTYGVAEYVQPSYMVLPRTGVMFRMARGTGNLYGDGRSFDGYGLDVDILLTARQAHTRDALITLARGLARSRALTL